jgi:hypothetical protein
MVFNLLIISEQIIGLSCELSRQFISFILRSSLRPPSCPVASTGGSSRCSPVPRIAGPSPHQLSNVDIPQTDAILVRPEAASMLPGGRRPAGSGGSGSRRSPAARPASTTRSGDEPHRSRGRHSDSDFCPSHRDEGKWTLNEELAVMRCLMSKDKPVVMSHQTYKEE